MFSELKSLLGDCGELDIKIRADGELMKVFVKIAASKDKNLVSTALPLAISATAEELDKDFVTAISTFQQSRKSLVEQVEATALIHKDAEKESAKSANKSSAKKSSADKKVDIPADSSSLDADIDPDEDEQTGANPAPSSKQTPDATLTLPASSAASKSTSAADDLSSLF